MEKVLIIFGQNYTKTVTVHCGKIMTISIELLQYLFLRQIKVANLHLKKLGQKLDSYGLHKCCVEPKKNGIGKVKEILKDMDGTLKIDQ